MPAGPRRTPSVKRELTTVPLVAWVASTASVAALLARLIAANVSSGDPGIGDQITFGIAMTFICFLIWMLVVVAIGGVCALAGSLRRYAGAQPGKVKRAAGGIVAVIALLGLCFSAATAWRGGAPGTGAELLGKIVLGCVLGGGTLLIACRPYLAGRLATRATRIVFGGFGVCLTAGSLLLAFGQIVVGAVLCLLSALVLYGFVMAAGKRGRRGEADLLRGIGAMVYAAIVAVLWARAAPPGQVAKWTGLTVVAIALSAATSTLLWRRSRGVKPWVKRVAEIAIFAAPTYIMLVLFDGQLLGGPLEAPLFPLMLWLVFRLWRMMRKSGRLAVKAGADIAFAWLTGSIVVLFLVWLGNLLDLDPEEVGLLKHTAGDVGHRTELNPLIWAIATGVLCAAHLLVALRPGRFAALGRRMEAAQLDPVLEKSRRVLTSTGIGLMVFAFLGLALPPIVGPLLGHELRTRYTIAQQEELDAEEATAVYQAITTQLSRSPTTLTVLSTLIQDVHHDDPPAKDGSASTTELAVALNLGRLQGACSKRPRRATRPLPRTRPQSLPRRSWPARSRAVRTSRTG